MYFGYLGHDPHGPGPSLLYRGKINRWTNGCRNVRVVDPTNKRITKHINEWKIKIKENIQMKKQK